MMSLAQWKVDGSVAAPALDDDVSSGCLLIAA
jgi:hypothetical protein